MKTFELRITPEKAREFLTHNKANRHVRKPRVDSLAAMMLNGQFETTHQGIAFDENGDLLDGQHRLAAIVQSGVTVQMLVTTGLSRDTFKHIDGGLTRTPADRLRLLNDERENVLAIGFVRAFLTAAIVKNSSAATIDLIENAFLEYADAFTDVARAFRNRVVLISRADVGAAVAIYKHFHRHKGGEFLSGLISGEGLSKRSPILTLREALIGRRVGTVHEGYWKTMGATKAHFEDRDTVNLTAATTDWAGNRYTRLAFERTQKAQLSAETRKAIRTIKKAGQQ